MSRRERLSTGVAPKLGVVLLLLVAWELYVRVSGVDPLLVPPPSEVFKVFGQTVASGELYKYVYVTLTNLLTGVLIGIVLAMVLTAMAVSSRLGREFLTTLTSMLNPLPAIAVLPLAYLWFGLSLKAMIFVIVNSVVWAMALNAHTGFETVPVTLRRVGQNMGLRGWLLVKEIFLPAALPNLLTGLKIGWAYGWRTIIAAELVFGASSGGQGGLGWMIFMARYNLETAKIFVGLVSIIAIGILVELAFQEIERCTVRRWGMTV